MHSTTYLKPLTQIHGASDIFVSRVQKCVDHNLCVHGLYCTRCERIRHCKQCQFVGNAQCTPDAPNAMEAQVFKHARMLKICALQFAIIFRCTSFLVAVICIHVGLETIQPLVISCASFTMIRHILKHARLTEVLCGGRYVCNGERKNVRR